MAEENANTTEKKGSGFDFSKTLKDTFDTIKAVFVKPNTKAIEKIKAVKDIKTAGIFAGFSIVIYIIVNLLSAAISTIVTKSCNLFSGKCETKVDFENLKNFDFFKNLGDSFLYIVGAIAIIAVVVYILGLIFKKQPNFGRVLAIATAAYAPIVVASFLGTIFGFIWSALTIFVIFAGFALAIACMVSAYDKEIALEGDKKLFFHILASLIIFIIAYFIVTNIMKSSLSVLNLL